MSAVMYAVTERGELSNYNAFCLHLNPAEYGGFPDVDLILPKSDLIMNAVQQGGWVEMDCAFLIATMSDRTDSETGTVYYGLSDYWQLKMHKVMKPVPFSAVARSTIIPRRDITISPPTSTRIIVPTTIVRREPTPLVIEIEV